MLKRLLYIAVFSLALTMPSVAYANGSDEPVTEMIEQEIDVAVAGRTVTVTGAEGMTLSVYDLAGNVVKTIAIDSDHKQFVLDLKHGLYLIRIGNVTRKYQVR